MPTFRQFFFRYLGHTPQKLLFHEQTMLLRLLWYILLNFPHFHIAWQRKQSYIAQWCLVFSFKEPSEYVKAGSEELIEAGSEETKKNSILTISNSFDFESFLEALIPIFSLNSFGTQNLMKWIPNLMKN